MKNTWYGAGIIGLQLLAASTAQAQVSQLFVDPGWTYAFQGDAAASPDSAALDGTWDHNNGSDSWDLGPIGGSAPAGGVNALTEGALTFIRIQDPGDPRDYTAAQGGTGQSDPSNRKVYFGHNIGTEGAPDTILDDGVTLSFRARLATAATGPIDALLADGQGAAGPQPWPVGGDGNIIHDNGKGHFSIKQNGRSGMLISFSLALSTDHTALAGNRGLLMNNLNGTGRSDTVDTGEAGTIQLLPIDDLAQWHEFWITIVGDISGGGTHRVDVYVDGITAATTFHVTAGTGSDYSQNYLAMGSGSTGQASALDVDFYAWKAGVLRPTSTLTCISVVQPATDQVAVADINQPAVPASVPYTVANMGTQKFEYTVTASDAQGKPVNWLTLVNATGSVDVGKQATVTANIQSAGLVDGLYTAYLGFSDTCAGFARRRIDLDVFGCRWSVEECNVLRSYMEDYPTVPIEDLEYPITNLAQTPVDYHVEVNYLDAGCANWLALEGATGTLPPGGQALVKARFDQATIAACAPGAVYSANLVFTDGCSRKNVTNRIDVRHVPAGATHVWTYEGGVAPTATDAAGPGLQFDMHEGTDVGESAIDPAAIDGRAWHIADTDASKTKYRTCLQEASGCSPPEVFNEVGATVVGRLKVTGFTGAREMVLAIYDTAGLTTYLHWSGATDGVLLETRRGEQITLPPDPEYHTFRLTAKGLVGSGDACTRRVRFYLDEEPTPVLEILEASVYSEGSNDGMGFGAGSTGGTIDVWFDWVSATNAGAFAPGEESAVLGRSLVPVPPVPCPDPTADTDGDGDVDQVDFGQFQLCFSNPVPPPPSGGTPPNACRCMDQDTSGFIDQADFPVFAKCAATSGPAIPADKNCDGEPTP
ncbi:MAG TPA: hypothetical protein PKY77_12080 [Phycisphaerae bacterium]|nr:hypothetical protein [Phycisphaerae bacterium]HRY69300.1 hypothetical protein [Phycisphaerae bacterium]HSA26618.1 hypothetical protein [Phycisphaerae bacterium]